MKANNLYNWVFGFVNKNNQQNMKANNLYNWVFWFNDYDATWYGIRRDRYIEFFSGPSSTAVYFEGKDIANVIEQINSYETKSVNE